MKGTTMSKQSDVVNADRDPDAVSNALGLDDATDTDEELDDDDTGDGDDDVEEDDEPTLADVLAELRELKRDNATLKREAAAARVAAKAKATSSQGQAKPDAASGETVEQAVERGKEEARLEYGIELAGASIRAALTGIIPESDLDDFVDDLRLERYVGEDGKPDREAIKVLKERQAKITRRKSSRTGHGRSTGAGGEKSKGDLMGETMKALGL